MMQPMVQVSLSIDQARYRAIADRAAAMGHKPSRYIGLLVDAAYLACIQREKGVDPDDRALDGAVQRVFLMADCEAEFIAQATGLQQSLVEKILDGWRQIAAELTEQPALPAPKEPDPVDRTVRVKPGAGSHSGIGLENQTKIAVMWKEGAFAAEIGAEVGLDADQVRAFAQAHRDLCPRRDNPSEKSTVAPAERPKRDAGYPVEEIRQMWRDGLSAAEIGGRIGKSAGAFQMWAQKHREICPHRRKQ